MRSLAEDSRDVDTQSSISLRSYQLRNTQQLPDRRLRRRPIGVIVSNAGDAAFAKGSRARSPNRAFLGILAADSSYLGYFRLPVPKGVDPDDLFWRRQRGLPHYKPQAEWIRSPFGPADELLQGRPPVWIVIHHDEDGFATELTKDPRRPAFGRTLPDKEYRKELVDAEELVERLRRDRYWQSALAAHPDSAIWLAACGVGQHEAQVIANAFNRTTHFPTGRRTTFLDPTPLVGTESDSSRLSFSVTDDVRRDFNSSLESSPAELRAVGEKYGWSALAVWGDADSLVPLIQTVTPT